MKKYYVVFNMSYRLHRYNSDSRVLVFIKFTKAQDKHRLNNTVYLIIQKELQRYRKSKRQILIVLHNDQRHKCSAGALLIIG